MHDHEIHVWFASLDAPPIARAELVAHLSADERFRAERYGHEQVRERFMIGRGLLRQLLALRLACPPDQVHFGYATHGKPHVLEPAGTGLTFNLAHSGQAAVFALADGREVGVDIEQVNPARATDDLAERFFSHRERNALRSLAPSERVPAFFRCWARKEAFIKAIGDGLTFPLDGFDVSLHPAEPASLL